MIGLNCSNCRRMAKPYVTAYEIAVKYGYKGTEKQWIKSLQTIMLARVTEVSGNTWECDRSFGELHDLAEFVEVHLITPEGRTAFPALWSDTRLAYRTQPYDASDETVYELYELTPDGGTFSIVPVDPQEAGSITRELLANDVQVSLNNADSAYQLPINGIPITDLDGSVQSGLARAGQAYIKPISGIPHGDISPEIMRDINIAPIIYIVLKEQNGGLVVDYEHTDLHGYQTPMDAVNGLADVRIKYAPDELTNPVITHPFVGTTNSGQWLVFAGPELYTDGDNYTTVIGFYSIDDNGNVDHVHRELNV